MCDGLVSVLLALRKRPLIRSVEQLPERAVRESERESVCVCVCEWVFVSAALVPASVPASPCVYI